MARIVLLELAASLLSPLPPVSTMRAMKIVLTAIVLFALSFQAAAARGNSIPAAEPHSTVLVSADIDAITVAANSDTSVTFTVRNRDATQKTYDITCSATGSATVTSCIPDSLTIPASQSAMVTVSFHVGSGTGSVSVTAFGGIGDTGTASTTVSGGAPVAPVVAPDGGNTSLVTNSSTQVAFSIYNPNTTGSETYTLSCTSGGVVTCSASAPLSVAAQSYGTGYATIYSGSTTGSGSISFTATDQNGGASDGGSYNVTVQAAPQIQLSPSSAGYQYTQGAGTPAAQSVTISNSQGGTFTWTASPDESWISVSPTNGAQGTNVSISVNTEELAVGSYNGSVTVSAAGATNSPQSIAVALTVSPPPPIPPTVTPDGGTAAMHTSSTIPLNFVVYNDNNNARTYSLSCGYNGSPYVTGCAVTGPTEITVAAASSDTVTVTATSGTSAGSGSVSLTALDENGVLVVDGPTAMLTVKKTGHKSETRHADVHSRKTIRPFRSAGGQHPRQRKLRLAGKCPQVVGHPESHNGRARYSASGTSKFRRCVVGQSWYVFRFDHGRRYQRGGLIESHRCYRSGHRSHATHRTFVNEPYTVGTGRRKRFGVCDGNE